MRRRGAGGIYERAVVKRLRDCLRVSKHLFGVIVRMHHITISGRLHSCCGLTIRYGWIVANLRTALQALPGRLGQQLADRGRPLARDMPQPVHALAVLRVSVRSLTLKSQVPTRQRQSVANARPTR